MSKKKDCKTWQKDYILLDKPIQKGGNGKVYFVCRDGKNYALKQLKEQFIDANTEIAKEKKSRFKYEIYIVKNFEPQIGGILPIVDCSIEDYWYVMPVAEPLMEHIKENKNSIEEIAQFIISLADVLDDLHQEGVSHRDIKPANIYFYKGQPCFSDFGLVGFSGQDIRHTKTDKGLGAIFTIAPEMKRNPKNADGKKADVFSMAKTLWMFLMNNELGFDGIYDRTDNACSLSKSKLYRAEHLVELEALLRDATESAPDSRPDIKTFRYRLQEWLDIKSNRNKSQNSEWRFLSHLLFGEYTATSASWTSCNMIANVLNEIGSLPVYNHMFLPTGGGMDFVKAEVAPEDGCLYIYTEPYACYIVKPKILFFEGFSLDFRWNYFLLELEEIFPVLATNNQKMDESLVEDYPGHYVSARYAQYGVYDYDTGEKLPAEYKVVIRYLRGKFLIAEKAGPYNHMSATYDARHNMCDTKKFRAYIDMLSKTVNELKKEGYEEDVILSANDENPFCSEERPKAMALKEPSPEEYIKNELDNISFLSCLVGVEKQKNKSKIKFSFHINPKEGFSFAQRDGKYTLCKDGYFRLKVNEDNIYYAYSRQVGQGVYNDCNLKIKNLVLAVGYDENDIRISSINFDLHFNGKPTHLFSEEEIRQLMKEADDRKNNILVIDEDGYAQLVNRPFEALWYPTRQESWCAGNIYVGKYSDLSDASGAYQVSLNGWLSYLETGDQQYGNEWIFYTPEEKEQCISEIKKYMES